MNKPTSKSLILTSSLAVLIYFSDIIKQTRVGVDDCLASEWISEVINVWISKFVEDINKLDKKNIKSMDDFLNEMIRISKVTIPNFTYLLEKSKNDLTWYNQFVTILFESGYFINPYQNNILKINSHIDVAQAVPELALLFWDTNVIKKAQIGKVTDLWNPKNIWCTTWSVWVVSENWVSHIYNDVLIEVIKWNNSFKDVSLKSKERSTIANEATHSILTNAFNFYSINQKLNNDPDSLTYSQIHEFLSDVWSYCIDWSHLALTITSMLRDIKVEWNTISIWKKVGAESYDYSRNFLLDLLINLPESQEIIKILLEQYDANIKDSIINDKSRIERARKIISKLSEKDILLIRLAYINEWRRFLELKKLDKLD